MQFDGGSYEGHAIGSPVILDTDGVEILQAG